MAGLASAGYSLFNGDVVDMQALTYAQMGAGLVGVVSKVPQVWTIYSEGGTGQLSAFMVSEGCERLVMMGVFRGERANVRLWCRFSTTSLEV